MSEKKRINYTTEEKQYLTYLVEKNKAVVENKCSNAVSNKQKEEAWAQICQNFNAKMINVTRDVDSLRKQWSNIKQEIRKNASKQRQELYKTGGGLPEFEIDENMASLANLINPKTIHGFNNPFDCDAIPKESTAADVKEGPNVSCTSRGYGSVEEMLTPVSISKEIERPSTSASKVIGLGHQSAKKRKAAPATPVDEEQVTVLYVEEVPNVPSTSTSGNVEEMISPVSISKEWETPSTSSTSASKVRRDQFTRKLKATPITPVDEAKIKVLDLQAQLIQQDIHNKKILYEMEIQHKKRLHEIIEKKAQE